MSDHDQHDVIRTMLGNVQVAVTPHLRPAGPAAARQTVRRRKRNRAAAALLGAALLVGAPTAGLRLAADHEAEPPAGAEVSASRSTSGPAAGTSGPAQPDGSAGAGATAAGGGRIPPDELANATLDIPKWPGGLSAACPSGRVTFSGGMGPQSSTPVRQAGGPRYADVDHDGTDETLVHVVCSPQGEDSKVLAYDRVTPGEIRLVGQVLGTVGSLGREGVDVMRIHGFEVDPDGGLRIDVGDYRPCCDMPADLPQHQWRTYGWNGQRFVQTGGPTAFDRNPNVSDLSVSAQPVILSGPQPDGLWRGTLAVTVRNAGPGAPPPFVWVVLPEGVYWSNGNAFWTESVGRGVWLPLEPLPVAGSRTVTLNLYTVRAPVAGTVRASVEIRRNPWTPTYPELAPGDNATSVAVAG